MQTPKRGGGWAAIRYTLRMARKVGFWRLWKAMGTKNTCKTCALGMGGQAGGMRNEMGHWPEVCKKSLQAMVADMQKGLEPEFFSQYSIDQLKTLSPRELEWCGRLTQPLFAAENDTHYRVISWDEALAKVVEQLRRTTPNENFFYMSGRSSNEAAFLLQLFARLYGTNFVNNCSYYCHQASGVGLSDSLGSGTATVTLEDVEGADLFVLIGGNPASNHPRLMRTLMNIRRRKGNVLVINPVKEPGLVNFSVPSDVWSLFFGSEIASLYVQPHIGGDLALLTGIAKIVLERGGVNQPFVDTATEGFSEYAERVRNTSWEDIEASCGVDRQTIENAANMYLSANNVVFGWTMGITHHEHGVQNVQSIVNLALLRGMVGRPKAGLLPIRGHSNIQGVGSVGVVPNLKQKVLENLESLLGVELPKSPGLDTMGCMEASNEGTIRSAFCLGGNLFGSNPDSKFAHRALGRLELITYLNTTLNSGHAWGRGKETLILPVLARDEEPEPTTQESMFNFVRLSDGQQTRLSGPWSEVGIITHMAQEVLGDTSPIQWQEMTQYCNVREMIAKTIPGYEKISSIAQTKEEFQIDGRTFHEPRFPTSSGKAQFRDHPIPESRGTTDQLRLMTVRSEGQFNTVVYEEEDIYRGQERRDVILMNSADIEKRGLRFDQQVTVLSDVGVMRQIRVRPFDIREGNALMYFPEANVLVPTTTDSRSKTPAFKFVLITIEAESGELSKTEANGAQRRSTPLHVLTE
ncbi:MAG: FdhF/YdeP family oxidoreductase [Gemmataceae bacterium]